MAGNYQLSIKNKIVFEQRGNRLSVTGSLLIEKAGSVVTERIDDHTYLISDGVFLAGSGDNRWNLPQSKDYEVAVAIESQVTGASYVVVGVHIESRKSVIDAKQIIDDLWVQITPDGKLKGLPGKPGVIPTLL